MKIFLDFETRSRCDLKKRGVYNYAEDPSTEIICLAFKINDGPVDLWYAPKFSKILNREEEDFDKWVDLQDALMCAHSVHAHNAQFERLIWSRIAIPDHDAMTIHLHQWRCSAAHAASLALPRSLEALGEALGTFHQKDKKGAKLIKLLSIPNKSGNFKESPELLEQMGAYCVQDVVAEHEIYEKLPPFPAQEQKIWELDQEINDRGIAGDLDGVRALRKIVAEEEHRLLKRVSSITDKKLTSARQVAASLEWLKDQGIELPDLRRQTVLDALQSEKVPLGAREFLKLRQSLSKSSVAKLQAFEDRAQADSRMRGLLLYHGASTGRWAGKGIQPQNFPRDSFKTEAEVDAAIEGKTEGCPIMAASKSLRGLIWSKNGYLTAVDFSSIEARVLAWVAGEGHILQGFREGRDMYKVAASSIYGLPYEAISKDSPERQVGKTAELALGYQGWTSAFRTMGATLGVQLLTPEEKQQIRELWNSNCEITDPADSEKAGKARVLFPELEKLIEAQEDARAAAIVKPWREARPATRALWYGLDNAARSAVRTPGEAYLFAGVKFMVTRGYLFMRLPSGRNLAYYDPKLEKKVDKYGREKEVVTFMGLNTVNQWVRLSTYGGKLTENLVQALARDMLVHAIQAVEAFGFPVVLHVHDELVVETDSTGWLKLLEKIAVLLPPWAEGLPMAAEGWTAKRYRK